MYRLGRAKERGRVLRDEARLPAVAEILPGRADGVFPRNEGLVEMHGMADGGPHADRIPPRTVELDGGVFEIAGQEQHGLGRAGRRMPCASGSCGIDEQESPARAAGAGAERFRPVQHVAVFDDVERGAEAQILVGRRACGSPLQTTHFSARSTAPLNRAALLLVCPGVDETSELACPSQQRANARSAAATSLVIIQM